jgi:hypothetical protein
MRSGGRAVVFVAFQCEARGVQLAELDEGRSGNAVSVV